MFNGKGRSAGDVVRYPLRLSKSGREVRTKLN
jgi:hypothetical protein